MGHPAFVAGTDIPPFDLWLGQSLSRDSFIPHLAKNERDVGHPSVVGWDRV
jgi:hypothetical protein